MGGRRLCWDVGCNVPKWGFKVLKLSKFILMARQLQASSALARTILLDSSLGVLLSIARSPQVELARTYFPGWDISLQRVGNHKGRAAKKTVHMNQHTKPNAIET